jgi:UDP-N-acetylmuramoylalanine--D-glutamate ligase
LPHRLEPVGSVGGVDFYNDSKATNPASAARALTSFAPGTVHLILGGRDKEVDWSELAGLVRVYARRVLLVGEAAEGLRVEMAESAPLIDCETVPVAVRRGLEGALPGDVVLLSPGCASFDQYRNFEERGEDFRRAVQRLAAEGNVDA